MTVIKINCEYCNGIDYCEFAKRENIQLKAELQAVRELLEKMEQSATESHLHNGNSYIYHRLCPVCRNQDRRGHDNCCKLKAELDKLEATK